MSATDWFRRLFAPSPAAGSAEDRAGQEPPDGIAGGVSGFAGLEDAEAVEDVMKETEAPSDPAP